MFSAMHYITFAEGADAAALAEEIQSASDAVTEVNLVAAPHEGGSNCGNLICRLAFENQDAFEAAKKTAEWGALRDILDDTDKVSLYEYAAYGNGVASIDTPEGGPCVHRVLMFADQERAKPEDVAALDKLMTSFSTYVPMLNWRVGTVVESSGSREWKHIWEQDFDSVDTFNGIYMFTPFHPTYLDTYFDTECHNWTADPFLCTMTCDEPAPFLANYPEDLEAAKEDEASTGKKNEEAK